MIERLSPNVIRVLAQNASPFLAGGTNCYLVGNGQKRILIDTGSPGEQSVISPLKKILKEEKCEIDKILITHWHYDHIGGVKAVLDDCTKSIELLKHRRIPYAKTYAGAGERMPSGLEIPKTDDFEWNYITDLSEISTDGAKLKILYTPGHADDHVCLWLEDEKILFSGDNILGETTCVFDNYTEYMKSLERLLDCVKNLDAKIFPGHGGVIQNAEERIRYYMDHRKLRENQILDQLCLKTPKSVEKLVEQIYVGLEPHFVIAAGINVSLTLDKLKSDEAVSETPDGWLKN